MPVAAGDKNFVRRIIRSVFGLDTITPTGASNTTFLRGDGTWAASSSSVTVQDSSTINLGVTGSEITASAITQMSITSDASGLKLSGDAATPGNSKLYGTNGSGTKGWYAQPAGSEAFPVGAVFIAVVSTDPATLLGYGTWSAFGAGRVLVGRDAGDVDFDTAEETGGAKTVTSTGTNAGEAAHTHSVTSNVTVADHASHTHTYTEVPNHVHPFSISSSTTDGTWASFDSSTTAGTPRNFNTSNPTGGVATGTTAGPSATLTHSPTNNAVTSGAGASHTHTFTGNATSVVQPYIVVYMWKRTA